MNWYLIKTEPSVYSISQFASDLRTTWNGVRNPQAVNVLKQMNAGDYCLVYHTGGESAIVGVSQVIGNSRKDPHDPKSWLVDMKFVKAFTPPFITLKDIKSIPEFSDIRLVRQSRLSVMDVPEKLLAFLRKRGLELEG